MTGYLMLEGCGILAEFPLGGGGLYGVSCGLDLYVAVGG